MEDIKNKIYNIELVLEDIKKSPQTYKTILGPCAADGTCQFILRRKINNLLKQGRVFKTNIPGTRFGKAIFYIEPKPYHILVEASRLGSDVYYFYKYEKVSKYYIRLGTYYKLEGGVWVEQNDRTIFEGNVLKFI